MLCFHFVLFLDIPCFVLFFSPQGSISWLRSGNVPLPSKCQRLAAVFHLALMTTHPLSTPLHWSLSCSCSITTVYLTPPPPLFLYIVFKFLGCFYVFLSLCCFAQWRCHTISLFLLKWQRLFWFWFKSHGEVADAFCQLTHLCLHRALMKILLIRGIPTISPSDCTGCVFTSLTCLVSQDQAAVQTTAAWLNTLRT